MIYILDAYAMIAFLRGERGGEIIRTALSDTASVWFAHWVNHCEVFHAATRDEDENGAGLALQALFDTGAAPRSDLDRSFCEEVGRLRARVKAERLRVSLADCFCITTAWRMEERS